MRARATLVAVLALAVAQPTIQPATAAPNRAKQVKKLKKQVRDLKRSRAQWRERAHNAEDALLAPIFDQVTAIAKAGRISQLAPNVFDPIRVNWPCGSSLFQGESIWSIDVNLSDLEFVGDELVEKDCSG